MQTTHRIEVTINDYEVTPVTKTTFFGALSCFSQVREASKNPYK